jgi:hypothetical protein
VERDVSSPRLNSFAKRTQRQVMRARQQAFDLLFGQTRACQVCGQGFTLGADTYRGVGMRDRVHVEVVRFACPKCGGDNSVPVVEQGTENV